MSRSLLLCALLCVALCSVSLVSASHFAYGTISWEYAPTAALPNHYLLNFESAWRRSYPTWVPSNPSAGQTFTGYDIGSLVVSQTVAAGPCCGLPSWNSCWSTNSALPGRGCGIWSKALTPINVLVKVTYPGDWLSGQTSTLTFDPPSPNNQRLTIVYTMCCRINNLKYSAGYNGRISADVVPNHQYSPRSTSFPRQYVIKGVPATWSVPSIHPAGWALTYALSSTSESSLGNAFPPTSPYGAFSLNTVNGAVTWTPLVLGLYAVQFKVMAVNPSSPTSGQAYVVLDTIFEVITECTPAQANCFHPPVFDPALPATATFYQGSSGTFTVTARSDDNHQVDVLTSPLPTGASITFVSVVGGTNSAGIAAKWTTFQVLWTPALTSTPATVCFTARDASTALSSAGSNCVNFVFGTGSTIYLSGLMRDFRGRPFNGNAASYLSDFNRPEAQVDLSSSYLSSTVTGGQPSFVGPATSVNPASFPKWFVTDTSQTWNLPQVYDIVLNNATTPKPNIFRWDSGANWWPLDNQLFGNEGDAHNRYFTLELHTAITYTGGETLLFESSDDLFVYIDGRLPPNWNMGGIFSTQLRSNTIQMDAIKSPLTDKQKTFNVDIFYAHRSGTGPAQLKLSLLSATLCNALANGLTVIDPATDMGFVTLVGAATKSGSKISLMPANSPSNTAAVWWNVGSQGNAAAQPYKVSHGFEALFSFEFGTGTPTEGFAFVLQFDNPSAVGGSGAQLGYGGLAGIKNSIAVEFDGASTSNLGDPSWNHVSIHTRFGDHNDANELSRVSGSLYSAQNLNLNFGNGTRHDVKIQFIPAADNGQGGPQLGWIRVFLGSLNQPLFVVPITSAQVDGVVLEQMWHGAAYAGFTASTSDTNYNSILISNFRLVVVPPSAAKSIGSVLPGPMTAGQVGSMTIQLKDVCGNTILTGNDCKLITASVTNTNAPTQTLSCCTTTVCGAGTIQDNLDGTYTLRYNPTFANVASDSYKIFVSYGGVALAGSPFRFNVLPGVTSAQFSSFAVTNNSPTGAIKAGPVSGATPGTSVKVTITARDVYQNLQTSGGDDFKVILNPAITGYQSLVEADGASTYSSSFISTLPKTYQAQISLGGISLPASPVSVTFEAGKASADTSTASGTGLVGGIAGQQGSFTLNLFDAANNPITQQKAEDKSCFAGQGCSLIPLATPPAAYLAGLQTGLPAHTASVPIVCAWAGSSLTCTYTTNVAYTYTVNLLINDAVMTSQSSRQVIISASTVVASRCIGQVPSGLVAGTQFTMLLQARDFNNNNLAAPMSSGAFGLSFSAGAAPTVGSPLYGDNGQYTITVVPKLAGSPSQTLTILVDTTPATATYPLTVLPGAADPLSSVSGVTTSIVASNTLSTFSIASRDQFGNSRTAGGLGADYTVTLSNGVNSYPGSVANSASATFTGSWGTNKAGSYSLEVAVASSSTVLAGGSVAVTVTPAATASANCVISGTGLVGGVVESSVSVSLIPYDSFNNLQLQGVTDFFRVQVVAATTTTYNMATRSGTTPFAYSVSYSVPEPVGGSNQYTVNVQRASTLAGTYTTFLTRTAVVNSATDSLFVQLSGAGALTAQNGFPASFKVAEFHGFTGHVIYGGAALSVVIAAADGTVVTNSISPNGASSSNWTVSYTPLETFPAGNTAYTIKVLRGSVESGTSTTLPWLTGGPYPLTLQAGVPSGETSVFTGLGPAAPVTAGAVVSFTMTLFDAQNNAVSYVLPSAITATISSLNTLTPAFNPVTLTGVKGANNIYTFTALASQFQRAATYSIVVSYNGATLGTSRQLVIQPGLPAAALSLVQSSASATLPASRKLFTSDYVAGTAATFVILVRDQFGNNVVPSLLPQPITDYVSIVYPDGAAQAAVIDPPIYTANGAFMVGFKAYKANADATTDWPINVSIAGTPVTLTPLIHVIAAGIAETSILSAYSTSVVAGTAITLTVQALDEFSNPWSSGGLDVTVSNAQGVNLVGIAFAVPSASTLGTFVITLDASYTRKVDTLTFRITQNGLEFLPVSASAPVYPAVVSITPGLIAAALTEVPALLPVKAGVPVTFSLGLRDAFGNVVDNLDVTALRALIEANYPRNRAPQESLCDKDNDVQEYGVIGEGFTPLTITGGVGTATPSLANVTFTPFKIGTYNVNITIGGEVLDCSALTRLELIVTSGPAVATNSRVVGLKDVTAGQPVTLAITLFDQFGNLVDRADEDVQVGQDYSDAVPFNPAITRTPSQWLQPSNGSVMAYTGSQNYQIIVDASTAGAVQVVVTLGGFLIPTYRFNSTSTDALTATVEPIVPLIFVTAGAPARFDIVNAASFASIRAAVPFTVQLRVFDLYSNQILALDAVNYNYAYDLLGKSTVNGLTGYSFTGTLRWLGNGIYEWTATSAYDGTANLVIGLVQLPVPACAGRKDDQNFLTPILCANGLCARSTDQCVESTKRNFPITVGSATCATATNTATPYRCPSGACVAAYTDCPELAAPGQLCSGATPVKCAVGGGCVANTFQCPCDNGQSRCPSGACVDDTTSQCHPAAACPTGQLACTVDNVVGGTPTGQCRISLSDCPSTSVCTPGFLACPDGVSCARSLANCTTLLSPPDACPSGEYRCTNGRCSADLADCPTPKTCSGSQVLCLADGSCADSLLACPDQYQCYAPTPFQCADGSCRADASGCPSQSTCPQGWVQCENGQCAATKSQCLTPTECPLSQVRCPSGTCVSNLLLCDTQQTCPDGTVMCSDRSCKDNIAFCVAPRVCPQGADSRVCPDGSCVSGSAVCPSILSCPMVTPSLCADGVTCVANVTSCVAPTSCPLTTPMRCPDGSCRGSLLDCPSRSSCPASLPVRCPDGMCVLSSQQCVSVPLCPAGLSVRCPGGECVSAFSLCPTHVTCPVGATLCADGSCRTECTECSTTTPPVCSPVEQTPCPSNLIRCPLTSAGSYCVSQLSQCPTSFICPAATPVRCLDTSCASSVSACPPLPPTVPETSKHPCPDGSWGTDSGTCNTPASCPPLTPYKCWDETCRAAPSDCSVPLTCSDPNNPYRCPNGACAPSPYDLACLVSLASSPCDPNTAPVKCPSSYECVKDIMECPAAAAPVPNAPTTWAASCPPQWAKCRDGSCKMNAQACEPLKCPANLPFACATGVCALNAAGCPHIKTGCYPPLLGCSTTGECVADVDDPAQCPLPDSSCLTTCDDGRCVSVAEILNYEAICASHTCALRCADKSCGLAQPVFNITADTPNNLCTQSGTQSPTTTPLGNQCPGNVPFRCDNGLCAKSRLECTVVVSSADCPTERPVRCANSDCVLDLSQCPPVFPCNAAAGEIRCGDGSCRVSTPGDNGCASWGIRNTCPFIPGTTTRYPRCDTGLCSTTADSNTGCVSLETGCPADSNGRPLLLKCPNGACLPGPDRYQGFFDVCSAPEVQVARADGCPQGKSKCAASGECLDDVSKCPNSVGCSLEASPGVPVKPFRCTGPGQDGQCAANLAACQAAPPAPFKCADGSLVGDATSCKMLNRCAPETPYRCADGSCKKFGTSALQRGAAAADVCAPTLTCPNEQVMCFDGSCVAIAALCAPFDPTSASAPRVEGTSCPPSVPVLCDNGACVVSIKNCQRSSTPGSGTGTGLTGFVLQQNEQQQAISAVRVTDANSGAAILPSVSGRCAADAPIECFDGSCVTSWDTCRTAAAALRAASPTSVPGNCPVGTIMCPRGECTPDPLGDQSGLAGCAVIPACGNNRMRCADGSCIDLGASCPATVLAECDTITFPGMNAVKTQRCQDGVCRYRCPAFDGCGHGAKPFQCSNRECAESADQCSDAAKGQGFRFTTLGLLEPLIRATPARRLLQSSTGSGLMSSTGSAPSSAPVASGTWCYSNCVAQIKAWAYSTMVDPLANLRLVVASDAAQRDFAWIDISAGALKVPSNVSRVAVTIAPVSDSMVRFAENRLPSTRGDVADAGFLTFVQTVLSPMFELSVDAAVAIPFTTNITITSSIDLANLNAKTPGVYTDICLAKLYQLPAVGYAAWRCLYNCQKGSVANKDLQDVRCAVRTSTSTGDASQVSGSVGHPGIYAFVETPVAQPEPESKLSWVQDNALWLFLGLTGAVVVIFFLFYCAQRLYRYRGKYKDEAEAVRAKAAEVDDMEQFGAQAGNKDEEVTMMSNPMVLQMKDMQARLDQTQIKLREQENQQKQEATVVRHEHIEELTADRDALAAELDRLRKEIEFSNASSSAARPQLVHMSSVQSSASAGLSVGVVASDSDYASGGGAASPSDMGADQPAPQARAEFQAQRPKKKQPKDE